MKRRTLLVAALATLLLAAGFGWFFWSRHHNGPILRLKVVRQTVEQGKPVVFFQVEGGGQGRIFITEVHQVIEGREEQIPIGASQGPFSLNPSKGRKEFGVLAPENTSVWKPSVWRVRVSVVVEETNPFKKLKLVATIWRSLGAKLDKSALGKTTDLWNMFLPGSQQSIESNFITNKFSEP